jgi:hypothetical protein
MQQRKLQNVCRAPDAALAAKKGRAAYREELLWAEIDRVEARPGASTMTDREIDLFTRKVDVVHRCREVQLYFGVCRGKPSETVNQPFGGEVGRGTDGERTSTLTLSQLLGSKRDPVEGIAYHSKIVAAGAGDDEAVALAVEEPDAKLSLQRFHLVADRSLSDTQLLRGAREALMPSRCVKESERVKRRKRTAHDCHS